MIISSTYAPQFKLYFYDALNQKTFGGQYEKYRNAQWQARHILAKGSKSAFEIVRIADGIILAQSKAAQS